MAIPAITHNAPSAGHISWGAFTIQLNGTAFSVPAGSSSQRWVWWEYKNGAPVINAGPLLPGTLTDDDLVLFGNKNGIGIRVQSSNFIDGELLVDGSILANAIAANQIVTEHMQAGTINGNRISANTITASEIAAGAVVAGKIGANAVTANEIAANAIVATKISAGAVVAGKIAANAVTATEISANAVVAAKIAAGAVVADKISAGAVVADKIAAGAVVADKISAGAVLADKIAANAVTAGKLSADAIDGKTITGVVVTGSTFRTAEAGVRWEMGTRGTGFDNWIKGHTGGDSEELPALIAVERQTASGSDGISNYTLDDRQLYISPPQYGDPNYGGPPADLWPPLLFMTTERRDFADSRPTAYERRTSLTDSDRIDINAEDTLWLTGAAVRIGSSSEFVLENGAVSVTVPIKLASGAGFRLVGSPGEPPLLNGFTGGSGLEFALTSSGEVHLRGFINGNGSSSAIAFVLPSGHRPSKSVTYYTESNGQGSLVSVLSTGEVQLRPKVSPYTGPIRIDCSFLAL